MRSAGTAVTESAAADSALATVRFHRGRHFRSGLETTLGTGARDIPIDRREPATMTITREVLCRTAITTTTFLAIITGIADVIGKT